MGIENLDEDLVIFINKHFPNLDWNGGDTSADADLLLDEDGTIDYDLMISISKAMKKIAKKNEEFTLTIRPSENKLIIYYID
jgi:hypothetical protein